RRLHPARDGSSGRQGVRRLPVAAEARTGQEETRQATPPRRSRQRRRGLMALRIVFAGTPEFAVPCLRVASEQDEVIAVYTQPDRPAGRGRQLAPSPVKVEASIRQLPVRQPENFKLVQT